MRKLNVFNFYLWRFFIVFLIVIPTVFSTLNVNLKDSAEVDYEFRFYESKYDEENLQGNYIFSVRGLSFVNSTISNDFPKETFQDSFYIKSFSIDFDIRDINLDVIEDTNPQDEGIAIPLFEITYLDKKYEDLSLDSKISKALHYASELSVGKGEILLNNDIPVNTEIGCSFGLVGETIYDTQIKGNTKRIFTKDIPHTCNLNLILKKEEVEKIKSVSGKIFLGGSLFEQSKSKIWFPFDKYVLNLSINNNLAFEDSDYDFRINPPNSFKEENYEYGKEKKENINNQIFEIVLKREQKNQYVTIGLLLLVYIIGWVNTFRFNKILKKRALTYILIFIINIVPILFFEPEDVPLFIPYNLLLVILFLIYIGLVEISIRLKYKCNLCSSNTGKNKYHYTLTKQGLKHRKYSVK